MGKRIGVKPQYKGFQNPLTCIRHPSFPYHTIGTRGDNGAKLWEFLGRGLGRPFLQKGPPQKLFPKLADFETISRAPDSKLPAAGVS